MYQKNYSVDFALTKMSKLGPQNQKFTQADKFIYLFFFFLQAINTAINSKSSISIPPRFSLAKFKTKMPMMDNYALETEETHTSLTITNRLEGIQRE